jgi:hypothetical protein
MYISISSEEESSHGASVNLFRRTELFFQPLVILTIIFPVIPVIVISLAHVRADFVQNDTQNVRSKPAEAGKNRADCLLVSLASQSHHNHCVYNRSDLKRFRETE